MKGDRMEKRSYLGSIVRKKLSDITNSLPQPQLKSPTQFENIPLTQSSTKEYIDTLLKENMALMQLLGEKNKIIELSGIEVKKLRMSLQKMQLQNWSLAQSNNHMLAELNLSKDKLKSLQHELACKDALLKAKNVELEEEMCRKRLKPCSTTTSKTYCVRKSHKGYRKMNVQNNVPLRNEECTKHKSTKDTNACNRSRRRPLRSRSMGPLTTCQQVVENETTENKRRRLRRQSARFKSFEQEPKENLFELEDINYSANPPSTSSVHEDNKILQGSLCMKKEENDENCSIRYDPRESKRTSFGRPSRKAAVKIQSYKETPLNIKMRRSE